jgi:peptidoglycan/LPS O-acetylase OafA/YrhL
MMAATAPAEAAPRAVELESAPAPRTEQRLYIPALDGVRFLAFFLVFLHHFNPGDIFKTWSPGLATAMLRISLFGWSGVDVFLTLSGFLIALLLLRELDATGTVHVRRFYLRRVLRIWPLYYLILVLGFFVVPMLFGKAGTPEHTTMLAQHLFPFATLFANFSSAIFLPSMNAMSPSSDGLSVLWTIALEEQFYLLFPLVMLAVGPSIRPRVVLACGLGLVAFSVATRYYILANAIAYPMVWMNTLAHLDPIVLGIMGAVAWQYGRRSLEWLPFYGVDVLLAIGLFWLVTSFPQIGQSNHTTWQVLAVSAAALLLIGAVLRYRPLGLAFGWRPIAWLGRISYGLYVYHLLAKQLYQYVIASHLPIDLLRYPTRWIVELLLVLGLTIAIAAVSYYGFERRFLRLKERFAIIPSRPA